MKPLLKILSILILLTLFGFWWMFIKSKTVTNPVFLTVCLNDKKLIAAPAESAKYISDIEAKAIVDTLEITIRTTTVFNPFANKENSKLIVLPTKIKFVKYCNKLLRLSEVKICSY